VSIAGSVLVGGDRSNSCSLGIAADQLQPQLGRQEGPCSSHQQVFFRTRLVCAVGTQADWFCSPVHVQVLRFCARPFAL
jgi:hypothetical protein